MTQIRKQSLFFCKKRRGQIDALRRVDGTSP
jgi:hypothetical protein